MVIRKSGRWRIDWRFWVLLGLKRRPGLEAIATVNWGILRGESIDLMVG